MSQPAHGYLIAKIINDIIGPYARVSNGRLYPLLAKLEQSGLIEAHPTTETEGGKRPSHACRITTAGRQRFRELMLDTTSNPGDYQRIFQEKLSGLAYLSQQERRYLLEHYLNYCQTHVLHLQSEIHDMVALNHLELDKESILEVMYHRLAQWQLELDWVRKLQVRYSE